jgi:ComF family protein
MTAFPDRLLIRLHLGRLARSVLDLLLPPRCLGCGAMVDAQGTLCARCWTGLTFLAPPWCARCGHPFELATDAAGPGTGREEEILCGACIADPPVWGGARSVLAYDEASRGLVLGLKHGDRTFAAVAFGAWMARSGAELLAGADMLAPVPLHYWRLVGRRYNQSALLALAVGGAAGVETRTDLLVRRRRTRTQGGLTREGRRRNVVGAFAVRPRHAGSVAGRRIVLVDDVLTTGATLSECARVLLRAGAARVDILTLARVPDAGG